MLLEYEKRGHFSGVGELELPPLTESDLSIEVLDLAGDGSDEKSSGELSLQIASDLHLEFLNEMGDWKGWIKPKGQVLALLGDIGCPGGLSDGPAGRDGYREFLFEQSDQFEHVLVLTGNHEYYINNPLKMLPEFSEKDLETPYTLPQVDQTISDICNERPNLHFLNRKAVLINGVRVIGTTLWSKIPEERALKVEMSMNDYHKIWMADTKEQGQPALRTLKTSDTNFFHRLDLRFISRHINEAQKSDQKIVVLTHHTPLMNGTSDPKFDDSPLQCAFSTDLSDLLDGSKVHSWAFGHTHYNSFQLVNGVNVFSNQRGYAHQKNDDYKDDYVLQI